MNPHEKHEKLFSPKTLILLFLALATATATAAAQPLTGGLPDAVQDTAEPGYTIGPENLLQIKILGEGNLQSTFRVDDTGFITHPLAGRIKLMGKTVSEAEQLVENILKDGYIKNPHITIFVLEHSRFSVLGEVRQPGNYEIIGQLSLMEAISIAGGLTPVANEKKVRIIRKDADGGEQTIEANIQDMMDGKAKDNVMIQGGDIINVPKSFF
ncbi:MAG TPA: polysaccharide biosynthesis/export family protein [Verrucomicrobiae bacterium]|jgi:polysaccharide export outer membrane protein|nr:polysaccharide biosynthesis/export family protein [Verrucomicrobiae bacterium]